MIWTSVEPTLGVIGACLPTLSPIFKGRSPASMIASVRSVLSLSSLRSVARRSGSRNGTDEEDMANLQDSSEKGNIDKRFENIGHQIGEEYPPANGQIMKKMDFELHHISESNMSGRNVGTHFGDVGSGTGSDDKV